MSGNKATASATPYGFKFGSAEVTRIHSDDKGAVWIEIKSQRDEIQVRVTKTGLIRIKR